MPRGPKLPPGSLEAATVVLLREALERTDLSGAGLAREVGISKSQVSRIFTGQRPLTMEEYARICAALRLKPANVLRAAERLASGMAHEDVPLLRSLDVPT